jgi:hypothetical protein
MAMPDRSVTVPVATPEVSVTVAVTLTVSVPALHLVMKKAMKNVPAVLDEKDARIYSH